MHGTQQIARDVQKMQFVLQTDVVALNCLSSQRCIALLFCAEEVIKKALSLTGEIFFRQRCGNATVGLAKFFFGRFSANGQNSAGRPNSAAQGSNDNNPNVKCQ